MAVETFATYGDYAARYGDADNRKAVEARLADASAFIAAQPGFARVPDGHPGHDVQAANLTRVTCAVVHRAMSAGQLEGVSSYAQTSIGYSANVSVFNPGGDFWLTKEDRVSLGIEGSCIGSIHPAAHCLEVKTS